MSYPRGKIAGMADTDGSENAETQLVRHSYWKDTLERSDMAKLPEKINIGKIEFVVRADPDLPEGHFRIQSTEPVEVTTAQAKALDATVLFDDQGRYTGPPDEGESVVFTSKTQRDLTAAQSEAGAYSDSTADKVRHDIAEYDQMRDKARRCEEAEERAQRDGDRAQDYFERMKVANTKLDLIRSIVVQERYLAKLELVGEIRKVLDQP